MDAIRDQDLQACAAGRRFDKGRSKESSLQYQMRNISVSYQEEAAQYEVPYCLKFGFRVAHKQPDDTRSQVKGRI